MVRDKRDDSGILFQSSKSHELIGAIVVGMHREVFKRLRQEYPGLDRNNGSWYARHKARSAADASRLLFTSNFLRYAGQKKAVVDSESKKLLSEAGLDPELPTYGSEHLEAIQKVLDTRQMRIFYFDKENARKSRLLEWAGEIEHNDVIAVTHYRGKYNLLQTTNALFGKFFCKRCKKAERKSRHRSCYDRHLALNRSGQGNRCNKVKVCTRCRKTWHWDISRGEHDCEQGNWCQRCVKHHRPEKMCRWQEVKEEVKAMARLRQSQWKYAAWDVETVQALPGDTETDHYVNLLVVAWTCYLCHGKDNSFQCENCGCDGVREKTFKWQKRGNDQEQIIHNFLDFALFDPRMDNRILLAHNGSKFCFIFDHHFLIDDFTARGIKTRYTIDGSAIVTIETDEPPSSIYNKLRFKDSYKIIICGLSDFQKHLNLSVGGKGVFPYKILSYHYQLGKLLDARANNPRFYGHVQRGLPPKYFYGVMNEKRRAEYEAFKNETQADPNFRFNFNRDLIEYCRQDVRVLLEGVVTFDQLLTGLCGWSPFSNCNTLAAFTLFVFRYNYANNEDFVYLPENGFGNGGIRQSEIGLKWLLWIEEKLGYRIQHAGRTGGEHSFTINGKTYHVDGYDHKTDTVYEFLGCYWHGCRACWKARGIERNANNGFSMSQLYDNTMARMEVLKTRFKHVIYVWECSLTRDNANAEQMEWFRTCDVSKLVRMSAREPLAGGRTEGWRTYTELEDEEDTIYYYDVTSLYPSKLFFEYFPVGEPQVRDEFSPEELVTLPFRGFIKATVLAPKDLKKALLPYRCNNRLVFPVCARCARDQQKTPCGHSDTERMMTAVWTDIELKKAVSLGYSVEELHETWSWPANQWRNDVYSAFISLFYKIKLCSSPWPEHLKTDEEREQFLEWHRVNMGLVIEASEIQPNSAYRFIAKLILNSLWGKMAQRCDLVTKEILGTKEHAELLFDASRKMLFSRGIHDKYYVAHKPVNEERHSSRFACLSHAAFVTSHGRLALYSLIEQVGEKAVYADTDSIIFVCRKGEANPLAHLLSGYLGELTDECPRGKRIQSVVVNGPKSYAINFTDGSEVTKCKGIQQNEATVEGLNYGTLKALVRGHYEGNPVPIVLPQSTIDRYDLGRLTNRNFVKVVQHVNHKSRVEGTDMSTAVNRPF